MEKNKNNYFVLYIAAVIGYYLITAIGFSVLRYQGINYLSPDLYMRALPMMFFLFLYVFVSIKELNNLKEIYSINIFKYTVISKLPFVTMIMVVFVFAEAFYKGLLSEKLAVFTLLAFLIGFSEESMFRGVLISISRRITDSKIFWILSSTLFFALLHMVNITNGLTVADAWNQTVHAIPIGLLAGVIFAYRNTLWPLICWHFSIDYGLFMGQLGDFKSLLIFGYIIDGILLIESVILIKEIYLDIKKYLNKNK